MIIKMIPVIVALLITQVLSKCSDELSCFKTRLFNFGSAGQNIYLLNHITDSSLQSQLNILAYGDFNNDLHTDFVAQPDDPTSLLIFLWNSDSEQFVYNQSLDVTACAAQSLFLYDMDLDGLLDVVVWGANGGQNCLLPYLHLSDGGFAKGQISSMQPTTNPFVISFGSNNGQKSVGLLAYQNGFRSFFKYESSAQNFTIIPWSNIFLSPVNVSAIPFADPHSNSYLDLTGDCHGDVVIMDNNSNIEFWINQGNNTFVYQNSVKWIKMLSLSFADMNYDGAVDFVMGYAGNFTVFLNKRELKDQTDFCVPEYKSVEFNFNSNFVVTQFPQHESLTTNALQIKDINIDGFPDLLVTLSSTQNPESSIVRIYISNDGQSYQEYEQYKLPQQTFMNAISASFIDFWENGILDIIVCTQGKGIQAYYNNYLQQNLFFIKGYGASGSSTSKGAQVVGASFYWVNSVGDGYRTTYQPQIPQTAYNALQTPYAYCGLGRANNYVQSFTLGIYGSFNSWSPIIPNSQLAVYAQGPNPDDWAIRIYVLPTESLIYVIIVSAIALSVLGIVLLIFKCRNFRKKDEPLMEFIH